MAKTIVTIIDVKVSCDYSKCIHNVEGDCAHKNPQFKSFICNTCTKGMVVCTSLENKE